MNRSTVRRGAVLALTLAALAATALALWLGVFRDGRAAASPGVDLVITKEASPSEASLVATGSTISYTLTVENEGDTDATSVDICDYIGSGLDFVSATPGSGVTCGDTTPPEINCTADIDSLDSVTVTIVVTVTAASGSAVFNGAYVDPDDAIVEDNDDADDPTLDCGSVGEGSDADDPTEEDNYDCTSHEVANADLTITKASSPAEGTVGEGSTIGYLLTVTNAVGATGTATNIPIRDYIGDGLDFVSVTHGTKVTCGDSDPPEINCTIDSLAPGQSATVTVTVSVEADSGLVLNGAYVDPEDAIAETNEDADDPDYVCGSVGEDSDTGDEDEPDNYDCTVHAAAEATPTPTPTPTATATPTPTPTATATPTPTPTPTATPTAGVLLNCPLTGRWAISVWDGPSGTATANALATCTGITIDAAYSLDRATNSWYRYFPGRTDVNNLLTLNDNQGIITLGR